MKYVLLFGTDESAEVTEEEATAIHQAVMSWIRAMTERGVFVEGHRLSLARDSMTVRVRDGEVLLSDGPFAETKEQIAGFDVIDCASLAEAVEVAATHPLAEVGSIEVRTLWQELPGPRPRSAPAGAGEQRDRQVTDPLLGATRTASGTHPRVQIGEREALRKGGPGRRDRRNGRWPHHPTGSPVGVADDDPPGRRADHERRRRAVSDRERDLVAPMAAVASGVAAAGSLPWKKSSGPTTRSPGADDGAGPAASWAQDSSNELPVLPTAHEVTAGPDRAGPGWAGPGRDWLGRD